MQKKALGRGLQSLIPVGHAGGRDEIEEVPLPLVSPNPFQPRRAFDEAEMTDLANSVKTKGILQPILVRRLGDGGYELIAGERRWRAAKLAGLKKIPAIVRPATDAEAMEMALIENLQRKDLNPMEAARAYQRLMKEFGLTQEVVARTLGKERPSIANTVRLLSLQLEVQGLVESDQLSLGHAKVLLAIAEPDQQIRLGRRAVTDKLSVRDLERLVRPSHRGGRAGPARKGQRPSEVEERMTRKLGTKVRLIHGKTGGKIVIDFYSPADLERVIDMILG
ncbi:MAG TPA: ParB/RepB/Spo0J family partition protein [Nitrospirales bacterium]|jgi:ParB family chromosome partitioning protein|nr:ParB/RepB/Spo0J family partition protein [Nitrospirales bacterium]